jgi:hypothetical protein
MARALLTRLYPTRRTATKSEKLYQLERTHRRGVGSAQGRSFGAGFFYFCPMRWRTVFCSSTAFLMRRNIRSPAWGAEAIGA